MNLLSNFLMPSDIREYNVEQLTALSAELRNEIIKKISCTGGHLAPSLGVVELTVALLKSFDPLKNPMIWDVGHQSYAYKLLTGRYDRFHTIRQFHGISGYPNRSESKFDHFGVGHSSTSISAALGISVAKTAKNEEGRAIAIIGDGAMTAGLAYEGLNHTGGLKKNLIVILNDNKMSISKNVGAISAFMSRKLSHKWLRYVRQELSNIPKIGSDIEKYVKRGSDSLKALVTPGMLFEALNFTYIGPIDGHDLLKLEEAFEQVKQIEAPVLIHVLTKKGKGYKPAEDAPNQFHGVGAFVQETGLAVNKNVSLIPSYTSVFSRTLCKLAAQNDKIMAITAAMPDGTGLLEFSQLFPERFFDVGICEQHAVTFAAGLATQGLKPVVAIYSSFMQRAYDQLLHDVCLQNLNVVFCLDRAGLVGADGATHHGVFDISFVRHIPNIILMSPADEYEMQQMLKTAIHYNGPVIIRYGRCAGIGVALADDLETLPLIPIGQGKLLKQGENILVIGYGYCVNEILKAATNLKQKNINISVYNLRFVKPLPEELEKLISAHKYIFLAEENAAMGGMGSAILEFMAKKDLLDNKIVRQIAIADTFIEHGTRSELCDLVKIDAKGIEEIIINTIKIKIKK